jgi:hypothetical protein
MASRNPQTMAKRAREQAVKERRERKRAKKAAAAAERAAGENAKPPGEMTENGSRDPAAPTVPSSESVVEFRYADGRVATDALHAMERFTKGDELDHDGDVWVMYDRVDRAGVTVHLFSPAAAHAPDAARARIRRRTGP